MRRCRSPGFPPTGSSKVLRDNLGLTGTKSVAMRAIAEPAPYYLAASRFALAWCPVAQADGCEVTTIEGARGAQPSARRSAERFLAPRRSAVRRVHPGNGDGGDCVAGTECLTERKRKRWTRSAACCAAAPDTAISSRRRLDVNGGAGGKPWRKLPGLLPAKRLANGWCAWTESKSLGAVILRRGRYPGRVRSQRGSFGARSIARRFQFGDLEATSCKRIRELPPFLPPRTFRERIASE